jgi:thiosulfate/3-mercaptopyruvate sulfurtransferase
MKPADEIQAFWKAAGTHSGKHSTFYCGTGWRASLASFYAWVMNWEGISVYDGGWLEWSTHPDNIRTAAA